KNNGGAKIPAAVLGSVITRHGGKHLENSAKLDFLLQQRVMVLFEQRDEFIGMAPFGLVVVLDNERSVFFLCLRGWLRAKRVAQRIRATDENQQRADAPTKRLRLGEMHGTSVFDFVP